MIINLTQMRIWKVNPHLPKPIPNTLPAGFPCTRMSIGTHSWHNGLTKPGHPQLIPAGRAQLPLGNAQEPCCTRKAPRCAKGHFPT